MISVIIPAYNAESTIVETLESILNQKYKNLQIIIVDDGSSDNTPEIVDSIACEDERVMVIHTDNYGTARARFTALSYAVGEYVAFVDSDDCISPELFNVVSKIIENISPDIISFGYIRGFLSGREKRVYNGVVGDLRHEQAMVALLTGMITPTLWDKVYKRKLFNFEIDITSAFKDIKINEDLLFNFFLFSQAYDCCAIKECLYVWKERKNSVSMQKLNYHKIYDPIYVKKYIMDHIESSLVQTAKVRYASTLIHTFGTVSVSMYPQRLEELMRIRSLIFDLGDLPYLSPKRQIQCNMIKHAPFLYSKIIRVYRMWHYDKNIFEKNSFLKDYL